MEGARQQQATVDAADAAVEPASTSASRLLRATFHVALYLVAAIASLSWLANAVSFWRDGQGTYDFSFYYDVALALRDNSHANIYDPHLLQSVANAHHAFLGAGVYHYPPVLPILLMPFTLLSFTAAARLWLIVDLLLSLVGAFLLVDWARRVWEPPTRDAARLFAVVTLFLTLMYQPLVQGVRLGQATVLVFFLVVLAAWLVQRGHPELAGALLALAAWIKVYPLLLIAYFVLRRERRVTLGAALGGALGFMLALVVVGIPGVLAIGGILANGTTDSLNAQNEALARVPFWIAVELGGGAGPIITALGYVLVAAVALIFVAVVLVWRSSPPIDERDLGHFTGRARNMLDAYGYAWALCTMVLVAPITWEHYDAWLLPAFVLLLGYALRARPRRDPDTARPRSWWLSPEYRTLLIALVAYTLTMIDLPFGYDGNTAFDLGPFVAGHPLRPLFMLIRPLSTLLLWQIVGLHFFAQLGATANTALNGESPTSARVTPSLRRLATLLTCFMAAVLVVHVLLALLLNAAPPAAAAFLG
jgi:hypothetical protein